MDRAELKSYMDLILETATPENQAVITEIMTNVSEGCEQLFTDLETARNSVSELTKSNETLRDVNAKLFLKVGTVGKASDDSEPPKEPPAKEMKFEDLFSDSGELL